MSRAQLPELVRLRWRMVRSERVRIGLVLMAAVLPGLVCGAVIAGQLAPRGPSFDVTLLAPTAFLGFAVLTLVAPLAAGGGNELFAPDQLVAYPIRPGTEFMASLLVAPLNLAWLSQFVLLCGITSFVTGDRDNLGCALVTALVFCAVVTVIGQALAWAVIGVRQTRRGRRAAWAVAGVIGLVVLVVLRADWGFAALDHAPTRPVVDTLLAGADDRYVAWASGTIELLLLLGAGLLAGPRVCAWALRRPGDTVRSLEARSYRRRSPASSALRALVAADRASVWRSAPLRRGVLVLTLLPAVVAAGASLSWESLVLVPALVCAGAGLLFGVNAFCLDAGGATWLASLPHSPRVAFRAKLLVTSEVVCGTALVAAVAAVARASGTPTLADVVATVGSVVSSAAVVLSTCAHTSVTRPRRAELRTSRDTPAPPAAMAAYSLRLASPATMIGLVFSLAAHAQVWLPSVMLTAALLGLSAVSLWRTERSWEDPPTRARVVTAVSSG